MTSPVTPDPSIHHDPTAQQDSQAQIEQAAAALKATFALIVPQIIQLIVNAVLQAVGLGKIEGPVDNLLTALENALHNFPAGNLVGDIPDIRTLIDGVVGGSGHPLSTLINDLQSGIGTIDPSRLTHVPLSAIASGNPTPNLVTNGSFDTDSSLQGSLDWVWDSTQDHTSTVGSGSAKTVATGSAVILLSNPISVVAGNTLTFSAYTMWSGLASTGNPIWLGLQTYLNNAVVSNVTLQAFSSPGSSHSWTQLSSNYTVPSGIDTVRVTLNVGSTATAGSVWFDDISAIKTGNLKHTWMDGITSGQTIGADLQGIVDNIHQAVNGGSGTGNAVTTVKSNLQSIFSNLFGSSSLGTTLQDAALPDITRAQSSDLQDHFDNVVEHFLGVLNTGQSADDASTGLRSIAETVMGLSQDVQSLKTAQAGSASSGKNYAVDFTQYPDGTFVADGVPFDLTHTGTGSGSQVISGGQSAWNTVADGDVVLYGKYNDGTNTDTDSDYQWIRATGASAMGYSGGNTAANFCCGRVNSSFDTYVYVKGYRNGNFANGFKAELGCFVSGTQHVFATNISVTWNYSISFKIGVDGDPYRFQVFSGNTLIEDYTDSAHVSSVGSSFRGWGFRADTAGGGSIAPGSGTFFGAADTVTVGAKGSGFYAPRTNTGTITPSSGANVLPASFFDAATTITPDLTWTPSTSTLTMGLEGWYIFRIGLQCDSLTGTAYELGTVLYRNGSIAQEQTGGAATDAVSCTFIQYCTAGDTIQPGYIHGGGTGHTITGEATGVRTSFSGALLNLSLQ